MQIATILRGSIFLCILFSILGNNCLGQNHFPPNGKVGVGTITPSSQLHLASDSDQEIRISRQNGALGLRILRSGASGAVFFNNTDSYGNIGTRIRISEGGTDWENVILNPDFGRVGIGVYAPEGKLHIQSNKYEDAFIVMKSLWYSPTIFTYKFRIQSDGLQLLQDNNLNYQFKAGGDFFVNNGKVVIGNINPGTCRLAVDGKIGAREVVVSLANPFPDYVFEKSYDLRPLAEVETFINENKHLPDVPSAAVVEKEGVNLGEMDAIFLRKIEELTLYTIQINKRMEEMSKEDERIKKENLELKKALESLNASKI